MVATRMAYVCMCILLRSSSTVQSHGVAGVPSTILELVGPQVGCSLRLARVERRSHLASQLREVVEEVNVSTSPPPPLG